MGCAGSILDSLGLCYCCLCYPGAGGGLRSRRRPGSVFVAEDMPGKLWWVCSCGKWAYTRPAGEDKCSVCNKVLRAADAKWLHNEFRRRGIVVSIPDIPTLEDFIEVGKTQKQRRWAKRQAARALREAGAGKKKDEDKDKQDNELPEVDRKIKDVEEKLARMAKNRDFAEECGVDVDGKEKAFRTELEELRGQKHADKPLQDKLRYAERKIRNKQKAVDKIIGVIADAEKAAAAASEVLENARTAKTEAMAALETAKTEAATFQASHVVPQENLVHNVERLTTVARGLQAAADAGTLETAVRTLLSVVGDIASAIVVAPTQTDAASDSDMDELDMDELPY